MKSEYYLKGFSDQLIDWFDKNQRDLPWRVSNDPYCIWISEIMLQQTRVEAVITYFNNWIKKWPNISSLANASELDVLNAWQGLGYYSRAKNILKTAQIIEKEYKGIFPNKIEFLLKLPGIGRYTAGAIASIAFGLKEPIVDGNVARVYARIFERQEVINDPRSQNLFYQIATDLLPSKKLSSFNQGLMELGALICVPQTPRCQNCPVAKFCKAFENNNVNNYPIRNKAPKTEKLNRLVIVIKKRNKVFMVQREKKGVFHGMWEFPGFSIDKEIVKKNEISDQISNNLKLYGKVGKKLNDFSHTFTKYKETVFVYSFTPANQDIQLTGKWVTIEDSNELPMGSVQKKIIKYVYDQKD